MSRGNNCIFVTYDKNLRDYLSSNNIFNILYGMHPKTNRLFWVYERNLELNKALDLWFNK